MGSLSRQPLGRGGEAISRADRKVGLEEVWAAVYTLLFLSYSSFFPLLLGGFLLFPLIFRERGVYIPSITSLGTSGEEEGEERKRKGR